MKIDDEAKKKIALALEHVVKSDKRVELIPTRDGLRVVEVNRNNVELNTVSRH